MPSTPPVDLNTAKNFCQVDTSVDTEDDALISSLVLAATSYVEHNTGRALVPRSCTMTFDRFPWFLCRQWAYPYTMFRLYRQPIISLDGVTYLDSTGMLQTLSPSVYQWTPDGRFGVANGKQLPISECSTFNGVSINYTSGYSYIPDGLVNAVLFLTRHWYLHRTPVSDVENYSVPMTVDYMLMPFVVANYG